MFFHKTKLIYCLLSLFLLVLAACGGDNGYGSAGGSHVNYSISGTVSGLSNSASLTLQNRGADDLVISANGDFIFPTRITNGADYGVTVSSYPAGQACTVTNGSGTVAHANVSNIAINCVAGGTIGGTITGLTVPGLLLKDNSGDNLLVPANSGSFTFATPIASGSGYAVSVMTQPLNQTCTVGNGSGTMAGANITNVTVTCVVNNNPHFAYVANYFDNDISAYSISASGVPAAVSGVATGSSPEGVAVDPTGQFAYTANYNGNSISAYTVDAGTGVLTQIVCATGCSGTNFAAGSHPISVTIDPTAKFAYVANDGDGTISAYTIDAGSGALSAVAGSPYQAGSSDGATPVTVDPGGKFVYQTNYQDDTIWAYSIDAGTGVLTRVPGSPFVTGYDPNNIVIDPSGKFAYVTSYQDDTIWAYTINAGTGALSVVTSGSFRTGRFPWTATIDPTGQFIYVPNSHDGTISAYTINASTGALTEISSSPYLAGNGPISVTIDPSGKFAYATNNHDFAYPTNYHDGTISAYTIDSGSGALTPVAGSPFGVLDEPYPVTVDPTGQFAYVTNFGAGTVSAFTIDTISGALTQINCGGGPGCSNNAMTTGMDFTAGSGSSSLSIR